MAIPTFGTPTFGNPTYKAAAGVRRRLATWQFDRGDPADALALNLYTEEPGVWVVTIAGASSVDIDTAQFVTGSRSCRLHRVNPDNALMRNSTWGRTKENRAVFHAFIQSNAGGGFESVSMNQGASNLFSITFWYATGILFSHGNGAGGSTQTTLFTPYLTNTWYEVEAEMDFLNHRVRARVVGQPWTAWVTFANDLAATYTDRVDAVSGFGNTDFWIDDLYIDEVLTTPEYGIPTF